MSTIVAIAASSVAIQASQQAHEAKLVACKAVVQTYDAAKATISDMQQYSDCVQALFPTNIFVSVWVIKALIISSILGILFGIWNAHKFDGYEVDTYVAKGLFGMIVAPFLLLILFCLLAGIEYLFT